MTFSILTIGKSQYYWSAKKKIYFQSDSTSIILELKNENDFEKFKEQAQLSERFHQIDKLPVKGFAILSLNQEIHKKDFNALKNNPVLKRIMLAHKIEGTLPIYFTGEVLLKPKPDIKIEDVLKIINNGASIKNTSKYGTYCIDVQNWDSIFSYANKIYESGIVEYCHPNFVAEIVKFQNDPLFSQQYYLNNTGQYDGTAGIDINAPEAWAISMGLTTVRVAMIDDGVENHEDFNGRVLQGYTPRDPNGFGAPTTNLSDPNVYVIGHGEACAGIIAASHNSIGIAGIATCSNIIPINIFSDWYYYTDQYNQTKVTFHETAQDVAAAINYAWDDAQADVISNSWGYNTTSSGDIPYADEIIYAISNARTLGRNNKGSVVVFASGNLNQYFSGVTFPANVSGVITVGAIDNNGNIWNYSSRGSEIDLVAPSGNVNLVGDVRTTDRMNNNGYETGNYTARFGGTSAACPQISGVGALMLSVNPNLTETQVRTILQQTATDMGSSGFDNTFGYGRLNAQAAMVQVRNTITISGPTLVCSSGATFTVSYVPSGCTVYWNSSSNITLPADRTTNPIVATANGTGSGWLQATINSTTCGSVILPQFQVYVGIPATPGTIGFRRAGGTCYYQAFISSVSGADSYDWSEDNVNWDLDSGTSYGLFDPYSTVTVYVRARNGCGVSPTKSKTQTMGNTPPDCIWRPVQIITDSTKSVSTVSDNIIIYPNPAESEVTVCVSDVSPASDEDVNISSVAIINSYGQTRKILHYGTGLKSVTINISDLPNGFYYIRLNNNAAGKSYKLLIQK